MWLSKKGLRQHCAQLRAVVFHSLHWQEMRIHQAANNLYCHMIFILTSCDQELSEAFIYLKRIKYFSSQNHSIQIWEKERHFLYLVCLIVLKTHRIYILTQNIPYTPHLNLQLTAFVLHQSQILSANFHQTVTFCYIHVKIKDTLKIYAKDCFPQMYNFQVQGMKTVLFKVVKS